MSNLRTLSRIYILVKHIETGYLYARHDEVGQVLFAAVRDLEISTFATFTHTYMYGYIYTKTIYPVWQD